MVGPRLEITPPLLAEAYSPVAELLMEKKVQVPPCQACRVSTLDFLRSYFRSALESTGLTFFWFGDILAGSEPNNLDISRPKCVHSCFMYVGETRRPWTFCECFMYLLRTLWDLDFFCDVLFTVHFVYTCHFKKSESGIQGKGFRVSGIFRSGSWERSHSLHRFWAVGSPVMSLVIPVACVAFCELIILIFSDLVIE